MRALGLFVWDIFACAAPDLVFSQRQDRVGNTSLQNRVPSSARDGWDVHGSRRTRRGKASAFTRPPKPIVRDLVGVVAAVELSSRY